MDEVTKQETPKQRRSFAFVLAILAKSTKLAKLAKVFKAMKSIKVMLSLFSMVLSTFVYALMLGPAFAIGFVALLFLHEMGHVIALRMTGYPTSLPVFIPFLGAAIFVPDFKDRETEAFVGIGGPLLGSVAAIALFYAWLAMPARPIILLLLSYNFIFINLFNLLPLRPLDGGRITQITGKFFSYIGVAILLAMPLLLKNPGLLLIWILVLSDVTMNYRFKASLGIFCQVSMMCLMFTGHGDQSLVVNIIDSVLASFFTITWTMFAIIKPNHKMEPLTSKSLPLPAVKTRVFWTVAYLSLTAILFGFMLVQVPYIEQVMPRR